MFVLLLEIKQLKKKKYSWKNLQLWMDSKVF